MVLWNIDLTLIDVGQVTRAAYADAFRKVTGRPLVRLPQTAGRTESEIFFDALALNEADPLAAAPAGEEVLGRFAAELRDAGADVVLADLADTANVVRAIEWLTTPAVTG